MLSETIQMRLSERFAAPLPEFYKRRIIFWHDEEGEFADQVDWLALSGVTVVKLTGKNSFAVKKLLTEDDLTGNYLIYDPLTHEKIQDDWLLDIELYSEEYRADLISMQMDELNIAPTPIMRKTVKLYAKFLESKDRKAKLRKLLRTGEKYQTPLQLHIDIMAVLCGLSEGWAQDVIIAVLKAGLTGESSRDAGKEGEAERKENNSALESIEKFGSIEAFWQLVQKYTGYVHDGEKPLNSLASHILMTALSQTMIAASLKGLERFISESCKAYCYSLVHEWQNREDKGALFEICRQAERELQLANRFDKLEIEALLTSDTFPAINESILKRLLTDVGEGLIKTESILKIVENRRTKAWHHLTSHYFDSLFHIAKIQEFHQAHAAGFHIVEPNSIWQMYRDDGYKMDSHYRHFHHSFGQTLKNSNPLLEDALKKAGGVVEGLYHNWYLKELTNAWTNAIASDMSALGHVSEIGRQREFYPEYVAPASGRGSRAFVVISDALRYEVAAELTEQLNRLTKGKATLEAQQAIFPSITKFGMAAMLPGKNLTVNDKMDVLIDGKPTDDTEKREAILKSANPNSVAVSFNTLRVEMKQQERRELVAGKEVVYIYHNEIDANGDKPQTEKKVFEACRTAVEELLAVVKIIVNELSGTHIFITADHGFLYTYNPLEESDKIGRQIIEGEIYETGRRYALVEKDAKADYLLPVRTDGEIGGMPMKGYAPRDTIRIRIQGGGNNYVHGGVSLQEMVVPVIVYKNIKAGAKQYVEVKNPGLSLLSEGRKISNLIFSLDFLQKTPVGEKVRPCAYNVSFTDCEGVPVSDRKTVIADRSSDNASERVFRVRFNLKSMTFDRNKVYRLVIANGTDAPEEIDFHIDIAFADDFGFNL
jgi:uncharacterized protein (TIGR02687 family)